MVCTTSSFHEREVIGSPFLSLVTMQTYGLGVEQVGILDQAGEAIYSYLGWWSKRSKEAWVSDTTPAIDIIYLDCYTKKYLLSTLFNLQLF